MRLAGLVCAVLVTATACEELSGTLSGDVLVEDFQFSPLIVSPGSIRVVTWEWRGAVEHNVTFEDGEGSGNMLTGTYSRDFSSEASGTYRYRCTEHSSGFGVAGEMIGAVFIP